MSSEDTGILVFSLAASTLVLLLIIACCHRYYKMKHTRATPAMLPGWDGHQTLAGTQPAGPSYLPAPANPNFQPLPNALYTRSPYHNPLPTHVQLYQQRTQPPLRTPTAADRQDHPGATPGAFQLNQQAAMATPNVIGCFYGAAYVPVNPYGPTNSGFVEQTPPQQAEISIATWTDPRRSDTIDTPPSYDQALKAKSEMTTVSE